MVVEDVVRSQKMRASLRSGPFGRFIDGYLDSVANHGYTAASLADVLDGINRFSRFLVERGVLNVRVLSWGHVDDFLNSLPISRSGKYEHRSSRGRRGVGHILRYLRTRGIVVESPLPPTPPFAAVLEEWVAFLRQHRGLAEKSLKLYRGRILPFLESLGADATPAGLTKLTAAHVRSYQQQLPPLLSRSERHARVSALRIFLRFALSQGYLSRDLTTVVDRVPFFRHEHLPLGPRWKDVILLPGTVNRSTAQGQRDYAILLVLITYGVRTNQVRELQLESVEWRSRKICFGSSKLGRNLEVPLTSEVGNAIIAYLRNGRPRSSSRSLFLSTFPPFGPLSKSSIYPIVCHAFRAAGIETTHPGGHAIRHAWATQMLAEGHSLKVIADLLGHRRIDTTSIYAKVDYPRLREVPLAWPQENKNA